MPEVAALDRAARVPCALQRVRLVEAAVHRAAVADAVEDEELVLGAPHRGVGDARGLEVGLGALGERARVALIALHVRGLDDVATQVERGLLEERVDDRGGRIRHQDHVGLLDALPAGDRRAVEALAVLEERFVHDARRDGHVLFLTLGVGEPEIDELDLLLLEQLQNVGSSGHGLSSRMQRNRVPGAARRDSLGVGLWGPEGMHIVCQRTGVAQSLAVYSVIAHH